MLQYLRQLVGVLYCGIFLPGNNIGPENKINNQNCYKLQTVHIFSQDIGKQFGIKKSGVVILATAKVTRTDVVKLSDGQEIKDIDENRYTY